MRRALIIMGSLVWLASPAMSQQQSPDAPVVLQAVLDCRTVLQSDERLACFDKSVAGLAEAFGSRDVVVADREQVREAKRGLFGLALPQIKLFSRDAKDEVEEITAKITSAGQDGRSKWYFLLDSGAQWIQTDTRNVQVDQGDEVRIRRGAMGSYLANVDGQVAIRVKRVQ